MDTKFTLSALLLACSLTTFAQVGPLTSGEAPRMEGSKDILGTQYRALRLSGTHNSKEVHVGIQPLGESVNRVEADLTYVSPVTFSLQYDPAANTLRSITNIGSTTTTVTRSNVSQAATAAGITTPLAAMNYLEVEIRLGGNNTGNVTLSNLELNGQAISGSYVATAPNQTTSRFWHLSDFDFGSGFTLTGTITLSGSFGNNPDNNSLAFTFGASPEQGSLPVKWGNVQVSKNAAGKNLLQWTTLEEVNTEHFIVQRSTNGKNFTAIAHVAPKGGSQAADYTLEDASAAGDAYYRIIEVSVEGKPSYSRIVSIKGAAVAAVVYDGRNTVRVQTAGGGTRQVQVLDMNGRLMLKASVTEGTAAVNVSSLTRGVYLVRVEGEATATRFVKQ
ncbi:MAG TPA: T9SS type A sorting domain-containing protein [Chitinophagaceae bacterium]|jgi:hypothetical protein|nr:T9SS type A sorting domain-containing protein [Chitinophagaceae bacterium]